MTEELPPPSLEEIKAFFFFAMSKAWAGGGKYADVSNMPGWKEFYHEDGGFRLRDAYCTNSFGPLSFGYTTIWYNSEPLWTMCYGGQYEKRAIVVVKQALLKAYVDRMFDAGRGPVKFEKDGMTYNNFSSTSGETDFSDFEGTEIVFDNDTNIVGRHDMWGMSLVPPK